MLAHNGPLRLAATTYGRNAALSRKLPPEAVAPPAAAAPSCRSPAHYLWALLLGRLFESLPLVRHCGADMCILSHIGEPAAPPRVDPARGPPPWDDGRDPLPDWDVMAQPELVYRFDQQVQW